MLAPLAFLGSLAAIQIVGVLGLFSLIDAVNRADLVTVILLSLGIGTSAVVLTLANLWAGRRLRSMLAARQAKRGLAAPAV